MGNLLNLTGKKGLIIGIANAKSIANGCAKVLHAAGAELAITYLNDRGEKYVRPLAEAVESPLILPCDLSNKSELAAVFNQIGSKWGQLDFVIHSVAFADQEDLQGRVVDCSREGFLLAMDISCHSFIRVAKLAEPLMKNGGSLLTMSYYGSKKVIPNYNLMGPIKSALEGVVRYLAADLGPKGIRVNAVSPGPIRTRASRGIKDFNGLLKLATERNPSGETVDIEEVGALAAFLISNAAKSITGNTEYIDAGYHIMG